MENPAARDVDRARTLQRLDRLAWILDSSVGLPATRLRIGVDALIGLIPVVGDAAAGAVSLYVVAEARRCGVPLTRVLRMLANVAVDTVLGSVPLVGDIFDVGFRANRRNVELLREWLERPVPDRPR